MCQVFLQGKFLLENKREGVYRGKNFLGREPKISKMGNEVLKSRLLTAAQTFLSQGKIDVPLKDIALHAKVRESVIYRYFSGKEDLLFKAVGLHLKEEIDRFLESLHGIRHPDSRLGRAIWYHLNYHDKHPGYARYLIFYCRAKKSFYEHEAYRQLIRWAKIIQAILQEGIREGVFFSGLPVLTTRDIILGLIDMEGIDFLSGKKKDGIEERFNRCYNLILSMVHDGEKDEGKIIEIRSRILERAEYIIGEKGFEKATTAEIAKQAGISESTLFNYFSSKDELLYSIIQKRLEQLTRVVEDFFRTSSPVTKLARFIFYHFTMYLRYPAAVKTFVLGGIFNKQFYSSAAYDALRTYLSEIDVILNEGKAQRLFRADVDNELIKNLLLGIFSHTALLWLFPQGIQKQDTISRINDVNSLVLRGILSPGVDVSWWETK